MAPGRSGDRAVAALLVGARLIPRESDYRGRRSDYLAEFPSLPLQFQNPKRFAGCGVVSIRSG